MNHRSYTGVRFQGSGELEAERPAQPSEIRPDTPEPEDTAMTVDEMNDTLFETARQSSLQEHMRDLLRRHGVRADDAAMDVDDDAEADDEQDDPVRPPSPAAEFDDNGRLTAHAKGKGRAD